MKGDGDGFLPYEANRLDELFVEIRLLSRIVRRASEHGEEGVAGMGKIILLELGRAGPRTVPQLARRTETSRQNIQIHINRLHQEGYVDLAANLGHQRSSLVLLTERGEAMVEVWRKQVGSEMEGLALRVTDKELTETAGVLRRLRQWIQGDQAALTRSRRPRAAEPKPATLVALPAVQPAKELPEESTVSQETEPSKNAEEEFPFSLL